MQKRERDWWKRAVIYQVYPRSFCDSNGDGIGDIPGIIRKLDYLKSLGVDAIWLSPFYCSPQADNGYDISDYRDVDPIFGTMADLEELIAEADRRGIGIVPDLVLNHTSDEHEWFKKAKSSRTDPCHDYYIWRDGKEGVLPDNKRAAFGGPAWEWVPEVQQYYYHHFAVKQPDLNWQNPEVREMLYDMIRFWVEKGVAGFRLDVVDSFGKEIDRDIFQNGPMLHPYIREMRQKAFIRDDLLTVGEAWSVNLESARLYGNPDGSELSMAFAFEHLMLDVAEGNDRWHPIPLRFRNLKKTMAKWQNGLVGCGWNTLFWENHDVPRIVSRFGDDGRYRAESAKMLAAVLFGMQGTLYIYQGQELGMTNVAYPIEEYRDVSTLNFYEEAGREGWPEEKRMAAIHAQSRDNARSPMQWDDSPQAGFTSGKPWMRVNPNYREINAAAQTGDPESVFSAYKELIRLRKEYPVITEGTFELLLPEHDAVFAYRRTLGSRAVGNRMGTSGEGGMGIGSGTGEEILVVANFYGETIPDPLAEEEKGMEVLFRNYADEGTKGVLRPYEAVWYCSR